MNQTGQQPKAPIRHVPRWTWIAGGGTLLAVGVVAALLPGVGGTHTAATHPAAPAAHSAKAAVPAKTPPAWPPHAVPVTKAQLGKDWPFKAPTVNGFVGCDAQHPGAIIFNPGSGPYLAKPFAINGFALAWGYPDVPKSIWLLEPGYGAGARKSIGPLQDRAPNRCQR